MKNIEINKRCADCIHKNTTAQTAATTVTTEQRVELRYKKIIATGIYNPTTKEIVVKKGTLVAKNPTESLLKAKNQKTVKQQRLSVLRKHIEPYNEDYGILAEDMTFTSLHQASGVITGAVLNPKTYWKIID